MTFVGLAEHHLVLGATKTLCSTDYAQLSAKRFPRILNRTEQHSVLGASRVGWHRMRARKKGKGKRQEGEAEEKKTQIMEAPGGSACWRTHQLLLTQSRLLSAIPLGHSAVGFRHGVYC